MYLLGIDIGTSGTKTAIYDENGNRLASYTGDYQTVQLQNGWAEQNPDDWWQATVDGIKSILKSVGDCKEKGVCIGLSGQMHGLVMLDKDNKVLRNSIIWCDQRTEKQVEFINDTFGKSKICEISANPAMTGFTLAKIIWVQQNEPSVYEKCVHIMLPKDYIRFKLTETFATDVSDASGMQLMDVKNRSWSKEILNTFNIKEEMLCKLLESQDLSGTVTQKASDETGLPIGSMVAAGAGDNAAAAIGTGVVKSGMAFNTIGSSAVIYTVTDKPVFDKEGRIHTFCASVPNKWVLMSCTQGAGISLKWFRDNFCYFECETAREQNTDAYIIMDKRAEKISVGADRLLFLPYLMGERSPHPDSNCRGVFFGLSGRHTKAEMYRAVLEGIAFSQKECLDVFRENGIDVNDMVICGGGAKSPLWRQIFADVYGIKNSKLKSDEGGTLGAALLAGVCAGVYDSLEEATKIIEYSEDSILPSAKSDEYKPYYELYKKLYPVLKDSFSEIQRI